MGKIGALDCQSDTLGSSHADVIMELLTEKTTTIRMILNAESLSPQTCYNFCETETVLGKFCLQETLYSYQFYL